MPAPSPIEIQIVFPGSRDQGQPDTQITPAAGRELLTLQSADGTKIAAVFTRSPASTPEHPRPTVIFFYGNGMCMADSLPNFERFRALGFNVIMSDYPGYGMSDGAPSEAGCYAAADAVFDYLLTRKDVDPKRIIPAGYSLGGAMAIELATRRPVAGVATFSAFTNIPDMNKALAGRVVIPLIMQSKFDNLAKIPTITCPIFMAHGEQDPLVPFTMMARLKKAAKTNVTVMPIENAEHNDLFLRGGDPLYNRFKNFVNHLHAAK
jgi:pimeloyl-ACP methyl ester carboxylesterase